MPDISIARCVQSLCVLTLIGLCVGCTETDSYGKNTLSATRVASFSQGDVNHGEYLSKVYACQQCHTIHEADGIHLKQRLLMAGGLPVPERDGKTVVYSANVTIASQYTAQVLDSTIRGRMSYKFSMPTGSYNEMSADNMRDLIAYIKALRPISNPLPDNHLAPGFVLPGPNSPVPFPEHEPAVNTAERGRYLSKMFTCQDCHSPRDAHGNYIESQLFQGGGFSLPLPDGNLLVAQNITPDAETGIGNWSDAEIAQAVRHGITRDGRHLDHAMPYVTAYQYMTDQDVADLIRFLRSLKPAKRSWPSTQPSSHQLSSTQPAPRRPSPNS